MNLSPNLFPVMGLANWDSFKTSMTQFFHDGLGGAGLQGVGIALAGIGIVGFFISFACHRLNNASRVPRPLVFAAVALLGTVATTGIDKPLQIITSIRDGIFGVLGI